ncbi:hypothetical protein ZIOFF_028100 [Zingiber officinale]|uniref:Pentatricopeptide repeat-containing protein n=1 Tax=Zingiber officinale TaxID=94328 RepID=A0A8J5GKU3_ZINOF|nr:hypothetical protein ZIOFF_028100 [Zingiber officinale]
MDVAATNSLINLYFKCGSIADAEKVFDGMLLRDVYTWNNRNKTSSKTLPRFQKLYSRRKLLSTSSCSPRFIAQAVRKEPTIEKLAPVSASFVVCLLKIDVLDGMLSCISVFGVAMKKWFLDKASIFRRAAEDDFLNIWDYEGICLSIMKFTNLKYSRVEIDEVRFEWAECMLDYI